MYVFWGVLALFYLVLAIVTYKKGRPVLKTLGELEDTIKYPDPKGKEEPVGLESLLYKAFKPIFITDVIGFILATVAAVISGLSIYC